MSLMPERRLMRPVYVCQLEEWKQMEVRKLLEGLIIHGCGGDKSEVERYYGMSFEEAVQNGKDSKIVDLDYLMVFYAEEYDKGKVDEEFRLEDAALISGILKEARKFEDVPPFVYPGGRTGWSCGRMSGSGRTEVCMKVILIGVLAVVIVLALAHGERVCRENSDFLERY